MPFLPIDGVASKIKRLNQELYGAVEFYLVKAGRSTTLIFLEFFTNSPMTTVTISFDIRFIL